jgi:microcystin-dependent protein
MSNLPIWNPLGPQAQQIDIGTSLPSSPIDGQEFILVDNLAAPTVSHHFRWTEEVTAPDKWVEIGQGGDEGPGDPAGVGKMWFSDTPPAGYAILNGQTLVGAQTAYPVLWANVDPAWKSGSDIITPDLRGRMPVGKGTHADVSALGNSDGLAVGSRRPQHKHQAAVGSLATGVDSPDHTHATSEGNSINFVDTFTGVGTDHGAAAGGNTGGASARHTHAITGAPTVGPQTGSEPTDSPGWIAVNWIIKLA